MDNIDAQLNAIIDYAKRMHRGNAFNGAIEYLAKEIHNIEDKKEQIRQLEDFKNTLKNKDSLTEGVKDAIKGLTFGALLATCLIQPAYAKTIVDNIHTHHPVTAKYESGTKGYDCIVKDNYGGYSYGKDQISTERRDGKPSTFDYFMEYAKKKDSNIEYHLRTAGGWEAAHKGDPAFIAKWCEMTFRKDFQDVYDGFMRDREFIPVYQRMDNTKNTVFDTITTWASQNKAVQAAVNSTIIQHGKNGAFNLINKIVKNKKIKTKEDFVKALYNARAVKFPKYKNRYTNELKDILNYLKSSDSAM